MFVLFDFLMVVCDVLQMMTAHNKVIYARLKDSRIAAKGLSKRSFQITFTVCLRKLMTHSTQNLWLSHPYDRLRRKDVLRATGS